MEETKVIKKNNKFTKNFVCSYCIKNISSTFVFNFPYFYSDEDGAWKERIRGFQPNSSRRSHAQLESSDSLDEGDSSEFGELIFELKQKLPWINVLGGCCGTHLDHIEHICKNVGQKV